jgi:hypothetical protein
MRDGKGWTALEYALQNARMDGTEVPGHLKEALDIASHAQL